jgi:hypothetical protein
MLRIVLVLVLGAHGIGHLIGVAGGWFDSAWGGSSTSWLLTPVMGRATSVLEGALWLPPGVGFVLAAGLIVGNSELWRPVALASAAASLLVIALFPEQLPLGSTAGAVVVDVVVIVGLLLFSWPAPDTLGA